MGIVIRMASFLRFLFCISIALIALIEIVHSMAYDVGKLKTKMTKMKSTLTRHNTKEQSKVSAQILLPKFLDKAKNAVGRLHEDEYTNGYATFELLVRRTQTGPWYRYQDLLGTEATNDFVENVILGGVEAEAWRMKLDNWISLQIFGKGTGIESISKVKDTLVQFKKLKPREFEFGYRIAVDGETVYSVEKSMKDEIVIPKSRSPSVPRINIPAIIADARKLVSESSLSLPNPESNEIRNEPLILMKSQNKKAPTMSDNVAIKTPIMAQNNEDTVEEEETVVTESEGFKSISVLNEIILQFYDKMVSNEADGCIFFSDGSATLSEDGLGCATACCGVFLLPTKKNIPLFTISESIRVDSAGGMIDSPFDAELIAGLSAVTLAKLIAQIITEKNVDEASDRGDVIPKKSEELFSTNYPMADSPSTTKLTQRGEEEEKTSSEIMKNGIDTLAGIDPSDIIDNDENSTPVLNIKNKIEFTLHTDSKTLCRAIRTGPKGDLADRASPSRLAMWKLLSAHMLELKGLGLPVTVEWIPGHPERRDTDRNRWTVRDIGIWMADEIAKINTNSVTAGFINNKKIDSNNNKLEVRDPEKQAKFPKKLTLKSPKKSGVKKKNYYNTKLTFSKDPKNPSVLAAAKLAGNNTVLSSNEELIADIISDLTELDNNGVKCVEEKEVEVEVVQGEGVDVGLALSQDNEVVFEKEEGEEDDEEEEEEVEVDREKIVGYEMEDVKIFEVAEREVTPVADEEIAPATLPISVIGAIDMIKLSTFLST